jgi:demethylmenaquinone methyltransferase/2-methoxy-6-polyprenyl-1,4-benzoquinol methylase
LSALPAADSNSQTPVTSVPLLPPEDKARHVQRLFSSVAPTYDLLNTLLSFGLHKRWRKWATDECRLQPGGTGLDVATGTGDFALELWRRVGPQGQIVGADFCEPMLRIGRQKMGDKVLLLQGDALALPFPNDAFDATTMGFGLRNVADIQQTLNEMARVVKPGGRVVQLELAKPRHPLFRSIYYLYFQRLLPMIGKLVHGRKENYGYLPASLREFASREEVIQRMGSAGLEEVTVQDLTFGIVTIFVGTKAKPNRLRSEAES